MDLDKCPIWGTPAKVEILDDSSWHVNSPRAGGEYIISGSWHQKSEDLDEAQKTLVTSWLVNQRSMKNTVPVISDYLEIDAIRHPSASQRAENLLKYINSQLSSISDIFRPTRNPSDQYPDPDNPLWVCYAEMLAWSASSELHEVDYLLVFLESQDFIRSASSRTAVYLRCLLTVKGHTHLAEVENRNVDSTKAFVAMWFDSSLDNAYHKGIKPGIEESGYTPVRIDQKAHFNKIDDEILAEIRRSKFLVVDLTEGEAVTQKDGTTKGGTRGSVYYEAGFAYGLGIPIIYTCRKDLRKKIHFDIRQYPCTLWNTPEELKSRLAQRISAIFGDGPASTPSLITEA